MLNRIKGIVYNIIGIIAGLGARPKPANKILILRVDEIGDYVLWRKFLHPILTAPQYKDYSFHFCGNQIWKSLFELEYSNAFKENFWLNKKLFKTSMWYRYKFSRQLYKQHYSLIINPTFSRAKRFDDAIVKTAKPLQAVALQRNSENYFSYEEHFDKNLYQQLISTPNNQLFDFERNNLFVQKLLNTQTFQIPNLKFQHPTSNTQHISNFQLPQNYFVVFPGSGNKSRLWSTENFLQASNHFHLKTSATVVICGSPADEEYSNAFIAQYKNPCINLTGKTSLPQMLEVLSQAQVLFSVDTGAVHLAASVDCPVIGIFNGGQYKRFAPYPNYLSTKFYPVYPKQLLNELNNGAIVETKYKSVIALSFNLVTATDVIEVINQHF